MKAFPVKTDMYCDLGMDLRDYFAAKVLQARFSDLEKANKDWTELASDQFFFQWMAEEAYEVADCMILQKEKNDNIYD